MTSTISVESLASMRWFRLDVREISSLREWSSIGRAAQGGGGATIPGSVQGMSRHRNKCLGHHGVWMKVGFNLGGLSQTSGFCGTWDANEETSEGEGSRRESS